MMPREITKRSERWRWPALPKTPEDWAPIINDVRAVTFIVVYMAIYGVVIYAVQGAFALFKR